MSVAIVIPAAGDSSRMRGKDKLLEIVEGRPILRLVAERAIETGGDVIVVVPKQSKRLEVLSDLDLTIVQIDDATYGMSASIAAGVIQVSTEVIGIMILPADMPALETTDLASVIQVFEIKKTITRGSDTNGTPGHPVIFPISDKQALLNQSGDQGAHSILAGREVKLVALESDRASLDLDTPEDWNAWRNNSGH